MPGELKSRVKVTSTQLTLHEEQFMGTITLAVLHDGYARPLNSSGAGEIALR